MSFFVNEEKDTIRVGSVILTLVVAGVGLFFVINLMMGVDLAMYKFWAPKRANVEREVFEQTRSFNQGMIQELEDYHIQYAQADDSGKETIRSTVLHRISGYNLDHPDVSQDLRDWIEQLKQDALNPQPAESSSSEY